MNEMSNDSNTELLHLGTCKGLLRELPTAFRTMRIVLFLLCLSVHREGVPSAALIRQKSRLEEGGFVHVPLTGSRHVMLSSVRLFRSRRRTVL